ncbi:hypothetical protein [uncultured Paraglaciecola sp.]|uniref:lipase family alpha/beta hydrolase n=1 Tax=uncultured Paraglaciecola sp. TaxID=1765024 RepID=UPI00260F39E4|nr:hypothetical protein [uncultured Paraglaciecola sp.]
MNHPNNEDDKIKVSSKIQGVSQLTIDAVTAITDIVESLHSRIDPMSGSSQGKKEQVSGIGGLVYHNVRQITKMVGKNIDKPLAILSSVINSQPDSQQNHNLLSAVNGVLGDYLESSDNSLAIKMQFRVNGQTLDRSQLSAIVERSRGQLLIMVHGLCMNDLQWNYKGQDHGAQLAKSLGMDVLYLHYNTGRHISDNGKDFAELLESLTTFSDKPLQLNIVAHSMGGLVSRSAYQVAQSTGYNWPDSLKKIMFLGTPHHGAALEKTGNYLDLILGSHFYTAPLSSLIKIRSAGITDLRYGYIQESDWLDKDRFEFTADQRSPVPLPEGVQCYAIATSTGKTTQHLLGDGLVSIDSALGKHKNAELDLGFPESRQWTSANINHLQMLGDQQVYQKLLTWLSNQ